MKRNIVIFLFLIFFRGFAFEQGPTMGYKLTGLSGDIGYGVVVATGTGSPTYIWRQYGEDVNFILRNVALFEFGSDRGNSDQRDIRLDGYPLGITAPNDMTLRVLNERIDAVYNGPMELLEVRRSGNNIGGRAVLRSTSSRLQQLARITADLEVGIPSTVADGIYTLATRFDGHINIFLYGTNSYYRVRLGHSAPTNNFDLITYLQISIDNVIDFGKVIFTSGAGKIIKRGNINISGGQSTNIRVKRLEDRVLLKRAKGEKEVVPVFIKLIDGKNDGEEINVRLDSSGRGAIEYEVRIEPGLYPDIPEGRYAGVAKFEIKYN